MNKPTLCLDFDGVIHSYTSGWKGAHVIPDPPVPGAIDFIQRARERFQVVILSSRSHQHEPGSLMGGEEAMGRYLVAHGIPPSWIRASPEAASRGMAGSEGMDWHFAAFGHVERVENPIRFVREKPPALVTIDDRAITFTGEWPSVESLLTFKPWNKR